MAVHSSTLAWKIPWTEEPVRLQSMGSQRVGHDWATSLYFTFMSIELMMPSIHLILCHPPLLPFSIFPSIRVFSNKSVPCIRWPKCWSFSFNISPSNEHSGLISFRMDCFDLLSVQGTLKSLLQHHSSKYQFFDAQTSLWSSSHIHTWLAEKP